METSDKITDQINKTIEENKFMENSISVGEGEDNMSFMPDNFRERRDLEQYFFTRENIQSLINILMMTYPEEGEIEEKVCLVCAPSLAKALYEDYDIKVTICDIDKRFEDLPGFTYFDLKEPFEIPDKDFDLILIDPPFFSVTLDQQAKAMSVLAKGNYKCKLYISFPHRDEKQVFSSFKDFNLKRTNFELEYATVKPNRWENYILYGNADLIGLKRVKK
ncbi:unnamed protein product [Moneuplotes crassus]|uniref:N6-adenine methyltransferase n=1 Tax=Euplotes crassus TaxID=5936 RepID=A0AAD2D5S4_EUPCR|nr:unnamed protein product [Moneuplotes crassus]